MSVMGVHAAEWVMPFVAASHLAVNAGLNAGGKRDLIPAVPDTGLSKERDAKQKLAETTAQANLDQQRAATLAEQQRVAGLPENVRKRATATAKVLGESGKRPTASEYLSGV